MDGLPADDVHAYLSKYIEANRVHLFEIVTQYKVCSPNARVNCHHVSFAGHLFACTGRCRQRTQHGAAQQLDFAQGMDVVRLMSMLLFHEAFQIEQVLVCLEDKLPLLHDRLNSVLGQTMGRIRHNKMNFILIESQHFAISMGRIGIDFRAIVAPLFERAALNLFSARVQAAVAHFSKALTPSSLYTQASQTGFSESTHGTLMSCK